MNQLLTYWPSLLLLILSAIAYGIHELHAHGKLKFQHLSEFDEGFFGKHSWTRKYTRGSNHDAPKTWYYRFFKIKYKERFPFSATLLVSLTDGPHAMQFIYLNGLSLAVALLFPHWLLPFVIVRGIFGIVFSLTYKVFSR